MSTFLVTYWTNNSALIEAESLRDAARIAGYDDAAIAQGIHLWEFDDSIEVTNSDGEKVATIELDYGTMDIEVEFPECDVCGDPIDYCSGHPEIPVADFEEDEAQYYAMSELCPCGCGEYAGLTGTFTDIEPRGTKVNIGEVHSSFAGKPIETISHQDGDDDYIVIQSWGEIDKYGTHPAIALNWPIKNRAAESVDIFPTACADYEKAYAQFSRLTHDGDRFTRPIPLAAWEQELLGVHYTQLEYTD